MQLFKEGKFQNIPIWASMSMGCYIEGGYRSDRLRLTKAAVTMRLPMFYNVFCESV